MKLTHSISSKLNCWFMDDGTIGDNIESLVANIKKVIDFGDKSDLCLNTEKCEIYFLNATPEVEEQMLSEIDELLPGIRKLDDSSFELLGGPILKSGLVRMLTSKIESMEVLCNRLKVLDVHQALC